MYKLIRFIFLFIVLNSCKANQPKTTLDNLKQDKCKSYYDTILKTQVYTEIDETSKFLQQVSKFNSYLMKNTTIKDQQYIQGSFNVTLVWNDTGKIVHQELTNKKTNLTAQEIEILRVIANSPYWEPAKCGDKKVAFKLSIPIRWKPNNK